MVSGRGAYGPWSTEAGAVHSGAIRNAPMRSSCSVKWNVHPMGSPVTVPAAVDQGGVIGEAGDQDWQIASFGRAEVPADDLGKFGPEDVRRGAVPLRAIVACGGVQHMTQG